MPQFTTSDGLTIHYETEGFDREAPVVVFLNGMTQTTRNWTTHVRSFRQSYRVVTYDARGQGQSQIPSSTPRLTNHCRDLRELLDELDVQTCHLVGFSHGARVALGFATDFQDRLDRLVLCSATAAPTALARTIVRSWSEVLDHGGLEALSWAAIPHIVGNEFLEQNDFLLDNIVRASVNRNSEEGTRKLLEGLREFPQLGGLARDVSAPTLVISATSDPLVTTDGAKRLAELCGGEHRLVDNCGHTVPIERPDEFRDIVDAFLTQHNN